MPYPTLGPGQNSALAISERMRERAMAVRPITRLQAEKIAKQALQVSLKHMDRLIYAIPEDRNRNGTRKWVRTERLRENERASVEEEGGEFRVVLRNRMSYARKRHEMGKPGTARPRQRPYRRLAPWRDRTFTELRRTANLRYQEGLRRVLGTGGLASRFGGR